MKFSDSLTTALLTGYSCFTTFRVDNNSVKGFSRHVERLQNNSDILFGITPSKKEIITAITEFLDNQISQQILVRVAIFPENFSIIAPGDIKKIQIIVTGREVSIPQKPLTLELHENIRPLAHLKTSSLFQSLQTRKNAQKNGYSDSLFFYEKNITEGPSWNIIFGSGNILYFPDPSKKTFLEGFTQTMFKENLPDRYTIIIQDIPKESINQFEYAFIVSSGVGVIPVKSINNILFDIKKIKIFSDIYDEIEAEKIIY